MSPAANNAGKINKLVTVFAPCPCTWTVLKCFIPRSRSNSHPAFVTGDRFLARFGLYLDTTLGNILSAVSAKTRAITSLHRDSFLPKVSGFCPVLSSVNAYLFYQRAVSCKANLPQVNTTPGLTTHKQEFCSPSLQPSLRLQNPCFFAYPDSAV